MLYSSAMHNSRGHNFVKSIYTCTWLHVMLQLYGPWKSDSKCDIIEWTIVSCETLPLQHISAEHYLNTQGLNGGVSQWTGDPMLQVSRFRKKYVPYCNLCDFSLRICYIL